MKKTGFWISVTVVGVIGILLLTGLVFLEKRDAKEYREQEEAIVGDVSVDVGESTVDVSANSDENTVDASVGGDENPGDVLVEPDEITGDVSVDVDETTTDVSVKKETSLVFAGDVYLSGHVTGLYDAAGIEGVLEQSLLNEMQQADILMVNEEFPFATGGIPMEDKEYTFRVAPNYTSIFADLGVDIVSLANNHVLDYGTEALQETLQTLNENEIIYAGAGENTEDASALRTVEADGKVYGFLAASRVIPVASWNATQYQPGVFTTYDKTALVAAITAAQDKCDYLTVYVHWGIERNTVPEEYQRELAHAYIDAGADLVIGAHPHVLQGIEAYNGKLIFYSLGNFIFNQNIDKTMLVKMSQQEGTVEYSVIPAYAEGAKTKSYADTEGFYRYLEGISEGITIEDGKVMVVKGF